MFNFLLVSLTRLFALYMSHLHSSPWSGRWTVLECNQPAHGSPCQLPLQELISVVWYSLGRLTVETRRIGHRWMICWRNDGQLISDVYIFGSAMRALPSGLWPMYCVLSCESCRDEQRERERYRERERERRTVTSHIVALQIGDEYLLFSQLPKMCTYQYWRRRSFALFLAKTHIKTSR